MKIINKTPKKPYLTFGDLKDGDTFEFDDPRWNGAKDYKMKIFDSMCNFDGDTWDLLPKYKTYKIRRVNIVGYVEEGTSISEPIDYDSTVEEHPNDTPGI